MSAPVNHGTVALIAAGIIERKIKFGDLVAQDFSSCKPYHSTCETFLQQTQESACREAWGLVKAAKRMEPVE